MLPPDDSAPLSAADQTMLNGLVSAQASGVAPDLSNYTPETFDRLIAALKTQKRPMELAAWIRQPGAAGYGGSPVAAQLVYHAERARGKVVGNLEKTRELIDSYISVLKFYRDGMDETDTTIKQGMQTLQAQTQTVSVPLSEQQGDYSKPSATAPTSEDDS